jgi:hypothetical protein
MYDFLIGIPFKSSQSTLNFEVPWSAVSILVSGVIDTADHKKIDFKVEYLREYEAICKKALTRGSRAQMELFDEKKPEVENLVTGSLYVPSVQIHGNKVPYEITNGKKVQNISPVTIGSHRKSRWYFYLSNLPSWACWNKDYEAKMFQAIFLVFVC